VGQLAVVGVLARAAGEDEEFLGGGHGVISPQGVG
jgi:hypothetical protein